MVGLPRTTVDHFMSTHIEPSTFGIACGSYLDGQPPTGLETSVPTCPITQRICLSASPCCDSCRYQGEAGSPGTRVFVVDCGDDGPG